MLRCPTHVLLAGLDKAGKSTLLAGVMRHVELNTRVKRKGAPEFWRSVDKMGSGKYPSPTNKTDRLLTRLGGRWYTFIDPAGENWRAQFGTDRGPRGDVRWSEDLAEADAILVVLDLSQTDEAGDYDLARLFPLRGDIAGDAQIAVIVRGVPRGVDDLGKRVEQVVPGLLGSLKHPDFQPEVPVVAVDFSLEAGDETPAEIRRRNDQAIAESRGLAQLVHWLEKVPTTRSGSRHLRAGLGLVVIAAAAAASLGAAALFFQPGPGSQAASRSAAADFTASPGQTEPSTGDAERPACASVVELARAGNLERLGASDVEPLVARAAQVEQSHPQCGRQLGVLLRQQAETLLDDACACKRPDQAKTCLKQLAPASFNGCTSAMADGAMQPEPWA